MTGERAWICNMGGGCAHRILCKSKGHCEYPPRASEGGTPSAEWCIEAFWRVNPGRNATVPSLYLLDFAREVLRVYGAPSATAPAGWRPISEKPKVEKRTAILCRFSWKGRDGNEYAEHDVCLLWPDGVITNNTEDTYPANELETLTEWMPIPPIDRKTPA